MRPTISTKDRVTGFVQVVVPRDLVGVRASVFRLMAFEARFSADS